MSIRRILDLKTNWRLQRLMYPFIALGIRFRRENHFYDASFNVFLKYLGPFQFQQFPPITAERKANKVVFQFYFMDLIMCCRRFIEWVRDGPAFPRLIERCC